MRQGARRSWGGSVVAPLALVLPVVAVAAVSAFFVISGSSLTNAGGTLYNLFCFPPPLAIAVIAGLLAPPAARSSDPRRRRLSRGVVAGLIAGLVAGLATGVSFAIYALTVPSTASVVITPEIRQQYVIYSMVISPLSGMVVGALAALIRRLIEIALGSSTLTEGSSDSPGVHSAETDAGHLPAEGIILAGDDALVGESAPPGPPAKVRPTRRWANVVVILLGVEAAFAAVGAGLAVAAAGASWRVDAGLADVATYNAIVLTHASLARGLIVGELATAICFLIWLHRSISNAPALGAASGKYSPRWAVIAWFVPFASLVVPYRVMTDLQARLAAPDAIRAGSWLIRTWWILWLAGGWLGGAQRFVALQGTTVTQAATFVWTALVEIALFIAAVFAVAVVRQAQRLADAREARLSGRDADADALARRARGRRLFVLPAGFATAGALVLLVYLGSAIAGRPAGPEWATFRSTAGGFAVSLPRVPTDVPTTAGSGAASVVGHTFTSQLDAEEAFAVFYIDFPAGSISTADPQAVLDQVETNVVGSNERLHSGPLTLGAVPGRELRYRGPMGLIADVQLYLEGERLYGLEVDTTADRASSDTLRFFESFTLQPGP